MTQVKGWWLLEVWLASELSPGRWRQRLELSRWDGWDVAAIPVIEKRSHNTDFSPKHRSLIHKVSQGHSSGSK